LPPSIRKKKGPKPIDKENVARQDTTPDIAGDKNVSRQARPHVASGKENLARQDTTLDTAGVSACPRFIPRSIPRLIPRGPGPSVLADPPTRQFVGTLLPDLVVLSHLYVLFT
jgi:hypothetical protein